MDEGEAVALVEGEAVRMVTERLDNEVILTVGQVKAVVMTRTPSGDKVPLSPDGAVSLEPGGKIAVSVEGLAPNSDADAFLYSDPTRLGGAKANDAGRLEHEFTVPDEVPSGNHRFIIRMTTAEGGSLDLVLGAVAVDGDGGVGLAAVVLVVLGLGTGGALFLPAVLRRRRRVSAP